MSLGATRESGTGQLSEPVAGPECAVRAGFALREYELSLKHRATGRSLAGFAHRGVQLRDFFRVYLARRRSS